MLLAQAPFVEGAVAAAVAAEGGAELEAVATAARAAIEEFAGAEPAVESPAEPVEPAEPAAGAESISETLTLKNKLGLHARPAAMVARIAAERREVTIVGVDAARFC